MNLIEYNPPYVPVKKLTRAEIIEVYGDSVIFLEDIAGKSVLLEKDNIRDVLNAY